MKNTIFLLILCWTMNFANAQSEYDCIGRNEFYIVKADSLFKHGKTKKASEIKTLKIAEKALGKNYKSKRYFAETENFYSDNLEYDDGMSLSIPDDQNLDISFHIYTKKYVMVLSDGERIFAGMKAKDFKEIFPKSFSKRIVIKRMKGKKGKLLVSVYFSRIIDGQLQIEDSSIVFIFNNEKGVLQEFYSYEPS